MNKDYSHIHILRCNNLQSHELKGCSRTSQAILMDVPTLVRINSFNDGAV